MLVKRVASAAILIPIVAAVVYLGSYPFLGVILLVACLACVEYAALVRLRGLTPSRGALILLVVLCVLEAQWPAEARLRALVAGVPALLLTVEVLYKNRTQALMTWGVSVAGTLYIGGLLGHFIRLRALEHGMEWMILALVGTWVCDTGAYFVGVRWGRRRFFPAISPKKTWEGALGGLVSGVATVVGLGAWLLQLPVWQGLLLGLCVVLGATFGDLAESVIKRQVGVKDSGHLIPGHGGMLDRIDSLLFVVPIVYYFAILVG
ncbi:MAG: phosphatidate cytidylyltransferase [Chloroflexi bacterium]|nr:phosphatidate cytidylyltransferase [Chloroflexota bacterium]